MTSRTVRPNGEELTFELETFKKHFLLNGIDKLGLTLDKEDKIIALKTERSRRFMWLDGASMKVLETVAMYPGAGIWEKTAV